MIQQNSRPVRKINNDLMQQKLSSILIDWCVMTFSDIKNLSL